jgi:dephospho-CoA kinase
MKTVGITGGIGSGKSTVCRCFEILDIPVFYADDQAKTIINTDASVIKAIKLLLGDNIYDTSGLKRSQVAAIVFDQPDKLAALNAIVHPAVDRRFNQWKSIHANAPYVIKEAAILFESGMYLSLDYMVTVTAPLEMRIARVMKRDGVSRDQVLKRIDNQWDDQRKIELSQFTIHCNEESMVLPQLLNLHYKLLNS